MSTFGAFTVTRASTKNVLGSAGTYVSVANNTPAFEFNTDGTYRGLLVEPGATNQIRNNSMVGAVAGTPGTLPTNWGETLAGLTREVVATGTTNGISYVRLRFSGTASSANAYVFMEATAQIVATLGQQWAVSSWISVSGSGGLPLAIRLGQEERDAAGVYLREDSTVVSASNPTTWARFSAPHTTSNASVARVRPFIRLPLTVSSTYDFTIDIGWPQMETGSVATSPIVTTGSTAARVADVVSLTGASSLIGQPAGSMFAEFEFRNTGAVTRVIGISNGDADFDDTFRINKGATGTVVSAGTTLGASQFSITSSGTYVGQIVRVALGYATNDIAFYAQGVQIGTDNASTTPTLSALLLGVTEDGTGQLNGWIRSVALFPTRLPNATLASLTT